VGPVKRYQMGARSPVGQDTFDTDM